MLDYFKVKAAGGEYRVWIDCDVVSRSIVPAKEILLLDRLFEKSVIFNSIAVPQIAIEVDENAKSLANIESIVVALRKAGGDRQSSLLAIGGGVVQDIATFVASIFMRGIAWSYVPTTLLAMVDSCIGGKSSINVGSFKNLVGNFYPPQNIYIDLRFIDSLSVAQRVAGLAEAVKICYAQTEDAFDRYLTIAPQLGAAREAYRELIGLALHTKRHFIEIDEFDRKERLLLNFGHTFGHAIESASYFAVPHGIAVAFGMLVALEFVRAGELPLRAQKLETYLHQILGALPDIGSMVGAIDAAALMTSFESDKKHSATNYVVIVPDNEGWLQRVKIEKTEGTRKLLETAFVQVLKRFGQVK